MALNRSHRLAVGSFHSRSAEAKEICAPRRFPDNASMQIFADGDVTKAIWTADLLPNELAGAISGMIEQGLEAMKKTLER